MIGFDHFKKWINTLRPEWQRLAQWNNHEEHGLHGISKQLQSLTMDDWRGLRAFMASDDVAPKGDSYFRPVNRSKFVDSFSDVFQGYLRWSTRKSMGGSAPVSRSPKGSDGKPLFT